MCPFFWMVPVAGHQKTAPGTDQEVPWSGHFSPWKYLEIYRGGYFHGYSGGFSTVNSLIIWSFLSQKPLKIWVKSELTVEYDFIQIYMGFLYVFPPSWGMFFPFQWPFLFLDFPVARHDEVCGCWQHHAAGLSRWGGWILSRPGGSPMDDWWKGSEP